MLISLTSHCDTMWRWKNQNFTDRCKNSTTRKILKMKPCVLLSWLSAFLILQWNFFRSQSETNLLREIVYLGKHQKLFQPITNALIIPCWWIDKETRVLMSKTSQPDATACYLLHNDLSSALLPWSSVSYTLNPPPSFFSVLSPLGQPGHFSVCFGLKLHHCESKEHSGEKKFILRGSVNLPVFAHCSLVPFMIKTLLFLLALPFQGSPQQMIVHLALSITSSSLTLTSSN